ncbi:unnamed protein product [Caenorhabditis bovis]|uniref:Uncharacterized protein n=1 Tax=Caenorhabditis bovis TaxID=2654633 RepID=A0A8S1EW91_9PELO|nr:unnamed protein product [Caenorhabditis bovis]
MVEIFDIRANQWRAGPSLRSVRSGAGVTVCNGSLVVVGGHHGANIHQSAEVLVDGEWQEISGMTVGRRNAAVIAVNEHVFAVGGDDGSSNLKTIECIQLPKDGYEASHWNILETRMPQGRSYAGITLLSKGE